MHTSTSQDSSTIYITRLDSPIGRIEVLSDGLSITGLAIENNNRLPHDGTPDRFCAVLGDAVIQLEEYFSGTRTAFTLALKTNGTEFRSEVWQQLRELAFGTTVSYGELGRATGRSSAGRAIGGAVGANPIPIIIPCHRVLASNQRITGYSGGNGIPTKEWLLAHEGITHR